MRAQTQTATSSEESENQGPSNSGIQRRVLDASPDPSGRDPSGREITLLSSSWDSAFEKSTSEANTGAVAQSLQPSPTRLADSEQGSAQEVQFQLTLRPDQLARLWLREPSLNPNNVHAWSKKQGKWIPALRVPEVAAQISKARIQSIQMWSALCASRTSATIAAPLRSRTALRQLPDVGPIPSNRLLPAPSLSFDENAIRSVTEKSAARSRSRWQQWARAGRAVRSLLASLLDELHYLKLRISRRAKRHAYALALLTYLSISLVTLAIVVSRLVGKHEHGHKLSSTSIPARTNVAHFNPVKISAKPALVAADRTFAAITPVATPQPQEENLRGSIKKNLSARPMARFDNAAAIHVIDRAVTRARECVEGDIYGKLAITFFPSGYVQNLDFVQFSGDPTQRVCIETLLAQLRVSPFIGGPVTVQKSLHIQN